MNGSRNQLAGKQAGRATGQTLLVTRTFNAPCTVLFEAWTRSRLLERWWGETPSSTNVRALDVRLNGRIDIATGAGACAIFRDIGLFRAVIPTQQLVFSLATVEPSSQGDSDEVLYTVTFAEHESETQAVLQGRWMHTGMTASAVAARREAWERRLDRLEVFIAGLNSPFGQGKTISAATNK